MSTLYFYRSDPKGCLELTVDETYGQEPTVVLGVGGDEGTVFRLTSVEVVVFARGLLQAVERTYQLADMRALRERLYGHTEGKEA